MDVRIIDLFCGGGGFSRGFHQAGLPVCLAVDCAWYCCLTYSQNFPATICLCKDIRELSARKVREIVGEVDIIIGSPPCEPFTAASAKRLRRPLDRLYVDERGRLTLEYIRLVANLRPQYFVLENVPQLVEGPLGKALAREFERAGYRVYYNILRAELLGTPSRRTRLFVANFKLPQPKPLPRITVEQALSGLPDPRLPNSLPNHVYVPLSRRQQRELCRLRWGQALRYYKDALGRSLGNYERLYPYDVAPSIKGQSRFVHPYDDRLLTVREQARLMGFPDEHVFLGSKDQQYDMVGEAVPPTVSRYIAEVLKSKL
ncbi:MAG: DNA cytosine methyltransferase [bacterium]|nr:DNA cytosine methyltransferase [bacterium]